MKAGVSNRQMAGHWTANLPELLSLLGGGLATSRPRLCHSDFGQSSPPAVTHQHCTFVMDQPTHGEHTYTHRWSGSKPEADS